MLNKIRVDVAPWRAALVCGALFFALSLNTDSVLAQDEDNPPAIAVDVADAPDVPNSQRTGAHEPSAEERNSKRSAQSVVLAQGGKALLPIVIAKKASPETRLCASELTEYLGRISGAQFQVQTPDGQAVDFGPPSKKIGLAQRRQQEAEEAAARAATPPEALPASGLVIGTQEEYSVPALKIALAIHDGFDGREAFAIRTEPKRVLLISATDKGTRHAVNRMLETLGCRWFATGEHWEVIPSTPSLSCNLDITDRPTIGTRVIAFMDGAMSDETIDGKQYSERGAQAKWQRRNTLGASVGTSAGHAWHKVIDENHDLFLAHPEYFAEVDGKRIVPMGQDKNGKPKIVSVFAKLELGNPEVRRLILESARNFFTKNPDADMISFSPTDGGGFSSSPESQKLGTVSDAVYGMANDIARMLQKEFPGKMVGVYAYRETAEPPSFELEPNVYIEMATLFNMSKYTYDQLYDMWRQKAKNLGFYEYFSFFDADFSHVPGSRAGSIKFIKTQIPFYAGLNATAVFAQSSNAFGPHGRGYYLATKMLWNPNTNADMVLDDFYERAYGPAAAPMKRYHERISRDADTIFTDNYFGMIFRDVDEATRLAKDRPDVLSRLQDVKQYLHYEYLWRKAGQMPTRTLEQKAAYRAAIVEAFRHAYSMRHTYMAQWNMVADRTGRAPAALLNDISLVVKNKRGKEGQGKFGKIGGDRDVPNVWEGAPNFETPETIEANFQSDLKSLPAGEIEERKFNLNDLVAVKLPSSSGMEPVVSANDPTRRSEYYQSGSARYAFYSFNGEPIEVTLSCGQRFSRGDATWTLSRPEAKGNANTIIAQGTIPSDKTEHALSIKVPGKGAYFFQANFANQGGNISYAVNKPASILWNKTGSAASHFMGPVFYVPKGTKQIQYFFRSNNGGSNTVVAPDGKVLLTADGAGPGDVYTIDVPPGMDGKLWRISPRNQFRQQWFFNIPNIAAASPDALLVPREVAEKDGLPIRTQ